MSDVPPGFALLDPLDEVMASLAPVYLRNDGGKHLTLGFRITPRHCNPRGNCHGGVWATIADLQLGMNAVLLTRMGGPTVSLTLDYLGAATVGQWVEGTTRLLRATPRMAFVDAVFTADGEPALRASGVFRRKWPPYRDFAAKA